MFFFPFVSLFRAIYRLLDAYSTWILDYLHVFKGYLDESKRN